MLCALPGSPSQPFAERWRALAAAVFYRVNLVVLVMSLGLALRMPRLILARPAAAAWLAFQVAIHGGGKLLADRIPKAYARMQPALAAAFRVTAVGFGAAPLLLADFLDSAGFSSAATAGVAGAVQHGILLLLASFATNLVLFCAGLLPISWAAPLHLALTLHLSAFNHHTCGTAALAGKQQHVLTRRAVAFADAAFFSNPAPLGPPAALHPRSECAALLGFAQLSLGCALPLLAQACLEARAFQHHQEQRRRAGLPPEEGCRAQMYGFVLELAQPLDAVTAAVGGWALLAVLWCVAVAGT